MAKSKHGNGQVPEEHTLEFTEDGKAAIWWWTEEAEEILSALGPPATGFGGVKSSRWCG